ncbi:hypothetical protein BH18ACT16_BH18ACT16_07280 [soil metagenome]
MSVAVGLPPPATSTPTGGGSRWVRLCRAANDIEAHLLVGRLTEAGIETRSITDRAAPSAWLYGGGNQWAPVTVYVLKIQLEDAHIALAEAAFQGPAAAGGGTGPESAHRLPWRWWTTALAMGLVLSGVALAQAASSLEACRVPLLCDEARP